MVVVKLLGQVTYLLTYLLTCSQGLYRPCLHYEVIFDESHSNKTINYYIVIDLVHVLGIGGS